MAMALSSLTTMWDPQISRGRIISSGTYLCHRMKIRIQGIFAQKIPNHSSRIWKCPFLFNSYKTNIAIDAIKTFQYNHFWLVLDTRVFHRSAVIKKKLDQWAIEVWLQLMRFKICDLVSGTLQVLNVYILSNSFSWMLIIIRKYF